MVDGGRVPGLVALVVSPDRVLYQEAFGKLDVARNTPMPQDAIFRIASMTKPVTSFAIMMLAEEGKLSLDDPVSKYLPAFQNPQVFTRFNDADGKYETRPARRPITIRHLLANTSGLGYPFSSRTALQLQAATMKSETELPLVADPGDKWVYGPSTRVLGEVVEKLSGQSLDAYFQKKIFEPLRMVDTSFVVAPDKHNRVVTTHARVNGKLVEQPNPATVQSPVRGDGGLNATARDYGLFLQMLLNDGRLPHGRLLGERSVKLMGQNQIGTVVVEEQPAAIPERTRPFPLGAGLDKFGLGFQIASRTEPGMRSAGSYNWAGIFNTHFWVDPNRRVGVVLLMQVLPFYDESCIELLRGFEQRMYKNLH
jgi:CubicO group peptidase (beta-lactamase class C family)